MKHIRNLGGLSAFYMAAAYLVNMILFLVVLDYPNITTASQKVALLVEKQGVIFLTNLFGYVIFGLVLILFVIALYDRLSAGSPVLTKMAAILGIIWAGLLIASGMVANAGIAPAVALYTQDPAQAAMAWSMTETVANGLGNANGEILGGLMTLLISLAALRTAELPKWLNIWGVVVGVIGIVSLIPALNSLVGLFGIGQIIWFIGLGIHLVGKQPEITGHTLPLKSGILLAQEK